MHPSETGAREQACPGGLAVTGFWAKECTLTPSIRSESERGSCWTFIFTEGHVPTSRRPRRAEKSKDKGKRPIQRRIAKRNERPSTNPEKNRQRPPDHQARRRSRKESQVAQNGRERVIGQHEEKTQWMRTAKKVQQRKPAPPMRKNRPEQKNTKKNRDSF